MLEEGPRSIARRCRSGPSAPADAGWDIARLVDVAWNMAVGGDLAFPQVRGPRPAKVRLINAYPAPLQAAAVSDTSLARPSSESPACLTDPRPCSNPTGSSACCAHRATPICTPGSRTVPTPVPPPRTADPHPDSWRGELLAYLDTDPISNGPTEQSTS